jgi:hypothetical protein
LVPGTPLGLFERVIGAMTMRLASFNDLQAKGSNNGLRDICGGFLKWQPLMSCPASSGASSCLSSY